MAEDSTIKKLQQQLTQLEAENKRLHSDLLSLRENEARYRGLVEYVGAVFFEFDHNGKVAYVSPDIETVSEYLPKELTGGDFLDYIYPEDRSLVFEAFTNTMKGTFNPTEFRIVTKSGEIRWVRSFAGRCWGMTAKSSEFEADFWISTKIKSARKILWIVLAAWNPYSSTVPWPWPLWTPPARLRQSIRILKNFLK